MMKMYVKTVITIGFAIFLSSCSFSTFNLVDEGYKPKGKRIAVISGLNDDSNLFVAKMMTGALDKVSVFKSLSQEKIAKAIKDYPINIKGPYSAAYLDVDVDYSKTDVNMIKELQRKLGVDYMYVLWIPLATTSNGNVKQLHVVTQLFEFPGGKEVANGRFDVASVGGVLWRSMPTAEDDMKAAKETTEYVAKETAEKMGMLKR